MKDWLARSLGATIRHATRIQALWGGHGELSRIALDDGRTAIVKWARLPARPHDASTRRKSRSYDVEIEFYRTFAPRCDESSRVPELLAAQSNEREWILVLEDLDAAGFTGRTHHADESQLGGMLSWLASFHARFLGERADGVWPVGTYWHLDTRRDELANIRDGALRAGAERWEEELSSGQYQTLLHGDAKDENFCFARDGRVAAIDFQYAGRGCAMRDVAYLLDGRNDDALDVYFALLRTALARRDDACDADAIEREWRALYPLAQLDFRRFLAGWRPGR